MGARRVGMGGGGTVAAEHPRSVCGHSSFSAPADSCLWGNRCNEDRASDFTEDLENLIFLYCKISQL